MFNICLIFRWLLLGLTKKSGSVTINSLMLFMGREPLNLLVLTTFWTENSTIWRRRSVKHLLLIESDPNQTIFMSTGATSKRTIISFLLFNSFLRALNTCLNTIKFKSDNCDVHLRYFQKHNHFIFTFSFIFKSVKHLFNTIKFKSDNFYVHWRYFQKHNHFNITFIHS